MAHMVTMVQDGYFCSGCGQVEKDKKNLVKFTNLGWMHAVQGCWSGRVKPNMVIKEGT